MQLDVHTVVQIHVFIPSFFVILYQRETFFAVNINATNFKLIGLWNVVIFEWIYTRYVYSQ